jgi:hypothetical protein
MKATLEFNLPDENREHLRAVKATDLAIVLHSLSEHYRRLDHDDPNYTMTAEKVFGDIKYFMEAYNINLEELLQ